MLALTVQQPWATSIAQLGKDVENRSRRPPAKVVGQRIAVHVGLSGAWLRRLRVRHATIRRAQQSLPPSDIDAWSETDPTPTPLMRWLREDDAGGVQHAGMIVATARVVGYVPPNGSAGWTPFGPAEAAAVAAAVTSPWRMADHFAIVLADVRHLQTPVGAVAGALGYWQLAMTKAGAVQRAGG